MELNAEEADHDARHGSCLLKLRGGDYDGRPLFLAMEISMFSVCTMIYGDYPLLAEKLLESLKYPVHVSDFRIGLNEVSDRVMLCSGLQIHRHSCQCVSSRKKIILT